MGGWDWIEGEPARLECIECEEPIEGHHVAHNPDNGERYHLDCF